jgi:hypothetical protein
LDEAKVENSIGRNWLGGFDPPGRISNHFSLKLLVYGSSQVSLHRSVIHALRQPVPLSPDIQVRALEEFEKLERCILSVSQKNKLAHGMKRNSLRELLGITPVRVISF